MAVITCTACGRLRYHAAHSWCIGCYQRWRRHGRPQENRPTIACAACGEDRPHAAYGWCQNCYQRWNRSGRPEGGPTPRKPLQPCGTEAAYQRHIKNDETVDDRCRQARNAAQNNRRAKARGASRLRKPWTAEQTRVAYTIALATEDSPTDRRLLLEALGLVPSSGASATPALKATA